MDEVSEVLAILPDLDVRRVRAMLIKYGSAEAVINRCLDGQIDDDLPLEDEQQDVVELASNTTATTTTEYDVIPFETYSGSPENPTREVRVEDDNFQPFSYNSNSSNNEDLPDIPDVPPDNNDDLLPIKESASQSTVTNSQPAKVKRGRKKKEASDEANRETLARISKKKLPTNVAFVEVQVGAGLLDKSLSKSAELTDALLKALEVNGGMFEKNAALPCPCNVTLWEEALHPCAVRWIYHKPLAVLDNDEESDVVYAAPGSEFVAEIQSELCIVLSMEDFANICRPANRGDGLASFCRPFAKPSNGDRYNRLVIITPDPEQYFKHRQSDQRRQFRQKMVGELASSNLASDELSFEDIEMEISSLDFAEPPLDILVTVTYSTTSDHAAAIVRSLTKAVCERPGKAAKRQWDSTLVMEPGSTVNPADKPYELWLRQLEQISLVSGDVAAAIAERFGTPMSLHCAASAGLPNFASDLEIRRGAGVLERTRRVGPETSRRLHMLFTTGVDPETVFE